MKAHLNSTIAVLLLLVFLYACNKDKNKDVEPDISGEITGKWKKVKTAWDENGNFVADADEVDIPAPEYSAFVTFNGDGSGITTWSFTGQPSDTSLFSWSRLGTAEISGKTTKGSTRYVEGLLHIEKLTANELVLIDTDRLGTNFEINWTYYSR